MRFTTVRISDKVPSQNKTKRLLSVNHSTKIIHDQLPSSVIIFAGDFYFLFLSNNIEIYYTHQNRLDRGQFLVCTLCNF